MTDTLSCSEFLDLSAAVALDAADEADVRRVEQHAAEWAGAALGTAVAQVEPAAAVRGRLFVVVAHTPQDTRRRIWPRRFRLSTAWLAAAASFAVSVVAIVWVAALQGQIESVQREAQ